MYRISFPCFFPGHDGEKVVQEYKNGLLARLALNEGRDWAIRTQSNEWLDAFLNNAVFTIEKVEG